MTKSIQWLHCLIDSSRIIREIEKRMSQRAHFMVLNSQWPWWSRTADRLFLTTSQHALTAVNALLLDIRLSQVFEVLKSVFLLQVPTVRDCGSRYFQVCVYITCISLFCCWNALATKFCRTFFWLHCKDHLKWQCILFGRIFLTPFLLKIFNFIRYANNISYDIMVHNNLSIIVNLESDQHIPREA